MELDVEKVSGEDQFELERQRREAECEPVIALLALQLLHEDVEVRTGYVVRFVRDHGLVIVLRVEPCEDDAFVLFLQEKEEGGVIVIVRFHAYRQFELVPFGFEPLCSPEVSWIGRVGDQYREVRQVLYGV